MGISKIRQRYNWGGNYLRLDSAEMKVIPPAYMALLCVRDMKRVIGYFKVGTDEYVSFPQYAALQTQGIDIDVVPAEEQRCVFTLDMWKGKHAPWMHVGSGAYRGCYRLPQVDQTFWNNGRDPETGQGKLYAVVLNNPSTISDCGFEPLMPGLYLAQPFRDEEGFIDWHVHQPGFRYRSTDAFSVQPRDIRVPNLAIDYWIELPDVNNRLSFR